MSNQSHYVFSHTELDPTLLSTPYTIQTNWHIISGTASCGKTTLIHQLDKAGYRTVPETARLYIQKQTAEGGTHHIYTDPVALQRTIKDLQLAVEAALPAKACLFLDGALPGSLSYYRVFGLNPNEMLPDCFIHRYATIFLLEPLNFQVDEERVEEMAEVIAFLDSWQTRDYLALGYDVVRVPVLPPAERLVFVLENLGDAVT